MRASLLGESTTANFCQKIIGVVTAMSLLVACSGQTGGASATPGSEQPETASPLARLGSDADTGASEAIESVYTSLDLDDCEVLETYPEGGGQSLRCEGYKDIPLYVTEGDSRYDVDAGIPNEAWITSGRTFNSIGDTVEWRIHDGEAVAAILRYNFEASGVSNSRSSELAVLSVGQEGSPGCLIDWVPADAQPSQNVAARQIADQRAEDFDCSSLTSSEDIQLPESVLGTFDTTEGNCSENITVSRLTSAQDRFDFYYGYANVDSVTLRDGGYDIDATLFQQEGQVEVRPTAVGYRIEPHEQDDGIQFARESLPEGASSPSSLVRCDDDSRAVARARNQVERITFASGARSATVSDRLVEFALHDYLVRATDGQQLTATLHADGPGVPTVIVVRENTYRGPDGDFEVVAPDEQGTTEGGYEWVGVLPADGTYRVRVAHSGPAANGGAVSSYTLTVGIE